MITSMYNKFLSFCLLCALAGTSILALSALDTKNKAADDLLNRVSAAASATESKWAKVLPISALSDPVAERAGVVKTVKTVKRSATQQIAFHRPGRNPFYRGGK